MTAGLELKEWWVKTRSDVRTGPTPPSKIQGLEHRYGITLPGDFKDYILNYCPIEECQDSETTSWWAFDNLKNIPDEYEGEIRDAVIAQKSHQYVVFADYCIWCWAWAVSCSDDETYGKVAIIGGMRERFVADSFSDFVRRYTTDFKSVC